jgi:hypothetical protein
VRLHFSKRVDVPDRIFSQQESCVVVIIYSITCPLPCLVVVAHVITMLQRLTKTGNSDMMNEVLNGKGKNDFPGNAVDTKMFVQKVRVAMTI